MNNKSLIKTKITNVVDIKKLLETNEISFLFNSTKNKERFLYNIDDYISFLKKRLNVNHDELIIIVFLSINNNDCINYFYKNIKLINIYIYKLIFMQQYNNNINFLKKYIKIKKRSFYNLINHLNKIKKRSYTYFEIINKNNMSFYIPIINKLENIN